MDKAVVVAAAAGIGVIAVATIYGFADTVLNSMVDSGVQGLLGMAQDPGASGAAQGQ